MNPSRFVFLLLLAVLLSSQPAGSGQGVSTELRGGRAFNATTIPGLLEAESQEVWGLAPYPWADKLPDFSTSAPKVRANAPAAAAGREATVILGGGDGFGSGVFISADGWILTNYHVVATIAQAMALTGQAPRMRVYIGKLESGTMRLEPDSLVARVYRVSPSIDLAMLKIENVGKRTFPFVKLASAEAEAGTECYVIGSQGAGFPWLFRSGKVLGTYDYPIGITEMMLGADTLGASLERTRLSVMLSDCAISPGDSGGPLLDANGNLIGLTFATPANLSSGALGMHVALKEIRKFTKMEPAAPEGIPFDPWVAGLPFSMHAPPRAGILQEQGKPCFVLQYVYLSPDRQPVAELLCFDFEAQNQLRIAGTDTSLSMLPTGIWGMEERKGFSFDVFLVRRFDGLVAVGYTDAQNIVSEIRLDGNQDAKADVVWKRSPKSGWEATQNSVAIVDAERLDERGLAVIGQTMSGKKE
ncbi:MAG TPA: serine protease [Candidatus Eisenbacteria bacterium]|nr:serine protease [Candidatus Eisenbacteria bacterium]